MCKKNYNRWNLRLKVSVPSRFSVLGTAAFSRWFLLLLLILISASQVCYANFDALSIWELPADIKAKTLKTYSYGKDIVVKEIQYVSSTYKGKPVKIFGYYCYPKYKRNLPGLAIIHGGGGYAVLSRTILFAKLGYAAISIDLPGKGQLRWTRSRSTGPNMNVSDLLRVKPDISYNYLYHAVPAARSAVTYLANQRIVNPQKIGMLGLSWGGVITLIVNGVDKRLACAVPVFGSGFLDKGSTWQVRFTHWMSKAELDTYNKYFDARNYVVTQHAPLLYMTGSNDHCYYLPNFIKSYLRIPDGLTKLAIYPNGKHRVNGEMLKNIIRYLDHKLKGAPRFPEITAGTIIEKKHNLLFPVKYRGPRLAQEVKFFYSKSDISAWTVKKWEEKKMFLHEGIYYVKFPKDKIRPEILYYFGLKDSRGAYVSTPVKALMRMKTSDKRTFYIPSTPVEEIEYHRISPASWKKITGLDYNSPVSSILLTSIHKHGFKIKNKKNYYLIEYPPKLATKPK